MARASGGCQLSARTGGKGAENPGGAGVSAVVATAPRKPRWFWYVCLVPVRSFAAALTAGILAVAGAAEAQEAGALFDQGLGDMMAGRYKIGCTLIKRSLEIDPRPGTAFTLAECYSKAGKYASAVEYYDRYLALFAELAPNLQAQQQARADISYSERTRLVGLVAWLTVKVARSAPESLVVTHDGEPFPTDLFGAPLAVDPGPHVFTTRTLDGPLTEQRIDIGPGVRKTVVLQLRGSRGDDDLGSPYVEAGGDEAPRAPSRGLTPWVYVAGGVGVAGLLTGAATAVMALDQHAVMKRECDLDEERCTQRGLDAQRLINDTLTPINVVGWSVGGAGAVATVLLLVLDGGKPSRTGSWRPEVTLRPGHGALEISAGF